MYNKIYIGIFIAIILFVLSFKPTYKGSFGGASSSTPSLRLFHSPDCIHCVQLMPEWDKASDILNAEGINTMKINCKENPGEAQSNNIKGFPTIILFNGNKHVYKGKRDAQSIINFARS